MSIHTFIKKIKGWMGENQKRLIFGAKIALGASLAFYGGYVARIEMTPQTSPVRIECPLEAYMPSLEDRLTAAKNPPTSGASAKKAPVPKNTGVPGSAYVASKNGTKYYPAGCGSVSRIKDENKVWFTTETEAQASGRTRSSTCK